MKHTFLKFAGASVMALALATMVKAMPINGAISFSDNYTINTSSLATATAITSITGVTVSGATGDYSGIASGTTVDFSTVTGVHPFTVNPSTPYAGLWTITAGATTYSFDVNSTSIISQTSTTLSLEGMGTAYISGGTYDPTGGTWNLTLNKNGGLLNFSGGAAVPDSGATALLLGLGLLGLGMAARRRKAVKA